MGLTDKQGAKRVWNALRDCGHSKRIGLGIYEYQEKKYKPPERLGKIWHAMRIKQRFTVDDIALLTKPRGKDKTNDAYIKEYLKHLQEEGYVIFTGKRQAKKYVYRLTDKAPVKAPPYKSRNNSVKKVREEWEEFEVIVLELLRLVILSGPKETSRIKTAVKELGEIVGTI